MKRFLVFISASLFFAQGFSAQPQGNWRPRYVLRLELSQTHYNLSLGDVMKDAMNKATFDIPVDKDYYDSVKVGTQIVDQFRTGSLILRGSFGNWNVRVVGKAIY